MDRSITKYRYKKLHNVSYSYSMSIWSNGSVHNARATNENVMINWRHCENEWMYKAWIFENEWFKRYPKYANISRHFVFFSYFVHDFLIKIDILAKTVTKWNKYENRISVHIKYMITNDIVCSTFSSVQFKSLHVHCTYVVMFSFPSIRQ